MMKKALTTLALCYLSMVGIVATAKASNMTFDGDACNVEFRSDIRVSPDEIEIVSTDGARMLINDDNQLFVDNEKVDLDSGERALLAEYASEVRQTVPEIVYVALEGVEIGLTAVSEVFWALSENGPPASLLEKIDGIQEEVSKRMFVDGTTVEVKGGEIRGVGDAMEDLEPALEEAISDSVGNLIIGFGESIKDGDGGFAERVAAFADRMSNVERDIEARIQAKAENLEERAEGLCDQVYALRAVESQLHREVRVTRQFWVIRDA